LDTQIKIGDLVWVVPGHRSLTGCPETLLSKGIVMSSVGEDWYRVYRSFGREKTDISDFPYWMLKRVEQKSYEGG
tara:strand:- start:12156 stop:12380 length:225 start_codon:yes stop_codon:yes gene_type:complete